MRLHRVSNNASITLGRELGRGGEGAVYPVVGAPDLVAKIYLKPPATAKVEKLRSMARRASPALLRVAAWPVDVLADEAGAVRGFLMPKVTARRDVHELYSPKSRRRAFPAVDFRFVVRAATNIARAFAQVHAVGNVIGDVNHGNALVGRDGTVVLIDCDSFQVRDGARIFTCDVGVPLFTPPELSGQPFRGLRRNANHDNFGLAVLLFHLLYMGRHPFSGKYTSGDMPIERAIAESRFVYGKHAASVGMTPPPGTLPLEAFGLEIACLFEEAFAPPGQATRPRASEWVEALLTLEAALEPCGESPRHYLPPPPPGGACCWCEVERFTGTRLFGEPMRAEGSNDVMRLARLWDVIAAVPEPPPVEPIDEELAMPIKASREDPLGGLGRGIAIWSLVAMGAYALMMHPGEHVMLGLGYIGAAIAWRMLYLRDLLKPKRERLLEQARKGAREHFAAMIDKWNELGGDDRFHALKRELEEAKRRLLELPKRRESELRLLRDEAERLQRIQYLDLFRINKTNLPNVSQPDILRLAMYDIDTAEEALRRPSEVRSIARDALTAEMILAWAEACDRGFRFNPDEALHPDQVVAIDELLRAEQQKLFKRLRKGGDQLEKLSNEITTNRAQARERLESARKAHSKAEETTG
jgi:DNA-binding helix-hairpin-helix protein with protein kinase domain